MSALFEDIEPLALPRHRDKAIRLNSDYRFAAAQSVAALSTREFAFAAPHLPIVFARRGEDVTPVALLGLAEGLNAQVSESGEWLAGYIPAVLRMHPFAIVRVAGDDGKTMLGVAGKAVVAAGTEGAVPVFQDDGTPAETIVATQKFAAEIGKAASATEAFCKRLQGLDLFAPLGIRAKGAGGRVFNVTGFLTIPRERLAALDPADLHALLQQGYLEAIWLHIFSLRQLRTVAERSGSAIDHEHAAEKVAEDTDEPGQISFRRSTWPDRLS